LRHASGPDYFEYPNTTGANADFAAIDMHSLAAAAAEPVQVLLAMRLGW